METTKRSRACELELGRLLHAIDAVPLPGRGGEADGKSSVPLAQEPALVVFEDESEPVYTALGVAGLAVSGMAPPPGCAVRGEAKGPGSTVVEGIVAVFASLIEEGEGLVETAATSILPPLLLYGEEEGPSSSTLVPECVPLRSIASFLPHLIDTSFFLGRVSSVAREILINIWTFHTKMSDTISTPADRVHHRAWRMLGELLAVLVQADEVLLARPLLKSHWAAYAKSMDTARHNPGQFGMDEGRMRRMASVIQRIEAGVMAANAFRNCYEQSFGELDDDRTFAERTRVVITEMYERWEKAAAADVPDRRRLTAIVALTTFYQLHFGIKEKKLLRTVWASHKKIIVFHLLGDLLWSPCAFLLREIGMTKDVVDRRSMELVKTTVATLYEQQSEALIDEAHVMVAGAREWCAAFRLDSWQTRTRDAAECARVADVVLKGSRIADTMCRLLKTMLNCSAAGADVAMSRGTLTKMIEVVQTVKLISRTFSDYWPSIVEICSMAAQQWRCQLISAIDHGRAVLREEAASDAKARDSLQSLNVAATVLLASASRARLIVAAVALDLSTHKKLRSLPEWPSLPSLLSKLETLSRPRSLSARVCDCSFLLYHRHVFRLYFGTLLGERPTVEEISLTMLAATDCATLAAKAKHSIEERGVEKAPSPCLASFQDDIVAGIRAEFLVPLCGEIENDLRVLSHKHLKVDDRDKTPAAKYEFFSRILRAPALRVHDRVVAIKEFVEDYLSRTFYNLTAVSPHDCHTYAKMAMLAEFRYGLQIVDGHLPYAILNQGLDVVNVMKALGSFTATYNYDLYHNLFVEKRSSSRTLHVLAWEHVANSLRTHGMGVVNTSVNLAYQLIRKKLAIVNQFLDDDHIKALLSAETRLYEEKRREWRKMYPVKRGERVNRAMRDLGSVDDEETYFDRFRQTVTQLGNALGFVRATAAAAELVINDALVYDTANEEWLGDDSSNTDTEPLPVPDPTALLRRLMRENRAQDARNRQYIEKLVSFFRRSLGSPRFAHLSSLAILTPALTVNYVEHMLQCRERSRRRAPTAPITGGSSQAPSSVGAATVDSKELTYVDDGFVLGMTYLLSVVDGWESFAALNWFRSVLERVDEERRRLGEAIRGAEAAKTNNLKMQQLEAYEKEFKLLSYSFQSARMFFAIDEVEHPEGDEEDEE